MIVVHDHIQGSSNGEESGAESDTSDDDVMAAVHDTNKRRYDLNRDELYGDCSFIFWSAAEVERLWSHAKHILTNSRKGMIEADNFEALLFLKINKYLWESIDLAEADKARSRSGTAANLDDKL